MNANAEQAVLVALDPVGARALVEAAVVGLEGAPDGFPVEAGWAAKEALEGALDGGGDTVELVAIRAGLSALDSLLSHDPDLLVLQDDGTGLITQDERQALFGLLAVIRGGIDVDLDTLRSLVRKGIERGYDDYLAGDEDGGADARHDFQVEAVVRELAGEERTDDGVH
jgi:hypothetical protein